MVDRAFTEVDLRAMLQDASGSRPDIEAGRFVIEASHLGNAWEVIVEPDDFLKILVVVTAYSVG